MSYFEDLIAISDIGMKFNFKKIREDCWNFRCPFCGDSMMNRNKKRGYLYKSDNEFVFYCHNCGISKSLSSFLYELDSEIYKQWRKQSAFKKIIAPDDLFKKKRFIPNIIHEIKEIGALEQSHAVFSYLKQRCIPEQKFNKIFWTDDYASLISKTFPDMFNTSSFPKSGIVFKLNSLDTHEFAGYQYRTIIPTKKERRFVTCVSMNEHAFFGVQNPRFIVEGIFDSLFLSNSAASLNASLWRIKSSDGIYVNDCEPRNASVCRQIEKCIEQNLWVTLLPQQFADMDINDIVIKHSYDENELISLIESHSYRGLKAKVMFSNWKRL